MEGDDKEEESSSPVEINSYEGTIRLVTSTRFVTDQSELF